MRNSMFGNTLEEVMDLQKNQFPYRKLPWIQVTLSQQVYTVIRNIACFIVINHQYTYV